MLKTIIIILALPVVMFCQVGTVKGKVVDADSNYSMWTASVSLLDVKIADSLAHNKSFKIRNFLLGNVVDKNGNYEIKKVPFGRYIIKCSFVGYKAKTDTIVLDENHLIINRDFYLKALPIEGGDIIK